MLDWFGQTLRTYPEMALRALQDKAQSKIPALGHEVPYAIGNIRLTAWGRS